jgi:hypothetical protein
MSNTVKERLNRLKINMTHEERVELDNFLEEFAMKNGIIIIGEKRGCDTMCDMITDSKFTELVQRIKKKKKKQAEVPIEA